MIRSLVSLLVLLLTAGMAQAQDYAAGQVWEYRNRPADSGSLVRIQRVERLHGEDEVFHVSLIGVNIGGVANNSIGHLPVSRETLADSLIRLSASTRDFPSADEGIEIWKADEGGMFTIPLAEIVGIVDGQIPRQPPK